MFVPYGAAPTIRSRLLDRVHVLSAEDTSEDAVLASADVVVAASHGVAPSPGLLVRALGAGAVPVASHLRSYEEVITRDDDLGLLFEPGDVETLTAQLERLIRDDGLLSGPARERAARRTTTSTGRASRRASRRSTTRSPRAATRPRATPRSPRGSPTAR